MGDEEENDGSGIVGEEDENDSSSGSSRGSSDSDSNSDSDSHSDSDGGQSEDDIGNRKDRKSPIVSLEKEKVHTFTTPMIHQI